MIPGISTGGGSVGGGKSGGGDVATGDKTTGDKVFYSGPSFGGGPDLEDVAIYAAVAVGLFIVWKVVKGR